jgi:hypothetical protein
MEMSYEEWRAQIAALMLRSHIPKAFIDEHLTNRAAMDKLYQDGFTATEVLTHLTNKYQAQKSTRNRERLGRYAPLLFVAVMVPVICILTYGVSYWLSDYVGSVQDFLVFALIPLGMCVVPLVIMAIFWMINR